MRERITARVLAIDPQDRLLLVQGKGDRGGLYWQLVGGAAEPGETILETARRELFEETGLIPEELGPIVWTGDVELRTAEGEDILFRQTYVAARCPAGPLSSANWTDVEQQEFTDMRRWRIEDIRASSENFYPEELPAFLGDILAGRYPAEPIVLPGRRAFGRRV